MASRKPGFKYETWLKRYDRGPKWPEATPIVCVLWTDATWTDGAKEDATTEQIFTIGVVVEATPDVIKVAHEVHGDKSERGVTTVPASIVRTVVPMANFKAFK